MSIRLIFAEHSGKRDRHQAEEGRRERDSPRDTCQDGKQMKIMFGRGMEIGSFLNSVRSTQQSSVHFISCQDRASLCCGAQGAGSRCVDVDLERWCAGAVAALKVCFVRSAAYFKCRITSQISTPSNTAWLTRRYASTIRQESIPLEELST